jgi:hypothetical protein
MVCDPEDGGSKVFRNVGVLPHHYTVSHGLGYQRLFTEQIRITYEGVSKSFRTESITKYTLTIINIR